MATLNTLGCCALRELCGISYHRSNPDILRSLCREHWNRYAKRLSHFGGMIFFSGVVRFEGEDSYGKGTKYGPAFAEWLTKNGLGEVSVVGEEYNVRNAPEHFVRVWLWKPDMEAISRWWAKDKKAKAKS